MSIEHGEQDAESIRGLSFGSVVDHYELYRLDYPKDLVDSVVQYAKGPIRTALEVGAGTGKATRLFASRGMQVTALEPDPEMAHLLERETRGLQVVPIVTTFEAFTSAQRFDLVYAAAAWHWTNPASRWGQAVNLLTSGGVLALFRIQSDPTDPALRAAVDEIEQQVLPEDDATVVHPWSLADMQAVDGLTDVVQSDLPRVVTTSAADFTGRLSTVSAYLTLTPAARADALHRVRDVLPERFDIDTTVQLALARRA